MKVKYIIFDLDDTLMYEIDYLKSAYREIAAFVDEKNHKAVYNFMWSNYQKGENVFDILIQKYPKISKEELLDGYRNHFPNISLSEEANEVLQTIKSKGYKLGLITDGRSITQRNKLKALKIEELFDKIIVSEEFGSAKPDNRNFEIFIEKNIKDYVYIADNPKKDFVTPNKLGWTTICLINKGYNIHPQYFDLQKEYLPMFKVNSLYEVKNII